MRRLAPVAVVALVLAACGGGGGGGSTAQIKSAYEDFFSSQTSVSKKEALLQNGSQFKSVIQSFVSNPLAKNVSATVSSVTMQGSNTAKVVYTVKVSGSALGKQTGTAVRQNGRWKVGDASLCKLIALGGTTPAVCQKS